MNLTLLIVGIIILIIASDIFVESSIKISSDLKIPTSLIGLTVVAFGTSAPEAAVSITAALKNNYDVSIGNIVGSNICNLLLILGVCSIISPIKINKDMLKKDYSFSLISYFLLLLFCFLGLRQIGIVGYQFGFISLGLLFFYLFKKIKDNKNSSYEKSKFNIIYVFILLFSLFCIIVGGEIVVNSAVMLAAALNVDDIVIASTIVAIGTSLPELFTSIQATRKKSHDIAVGNVIGSNIFNILFILGTSCILSPLIISDNIFIDIIIMTLCGILLYLFMYKNLEITRKKGFVMLLIYIIYTVYIIYR